MRGGPAASGSPRGAEDASVSAGVVAVSIVVPAYNEGPTLGETLGALAARFPEAELILVSDGCTDDTCSVAQAVGSQVRVIDYRPNRGKGYAVRTGVLASRGRLVVFTDADLPFGVDGVARLLDTFAARPDADVVIAEKVGAYRGPAYRAARAVVRVGVRSALGLRQTDTQAGLKGFRRDAARVIFSQAVVDGFAADMEILALAAREGLEVVSVPLPVVNDAVRPSTFTPRQGARLIRDVWAIRRRSGRRGVGRKGPTSG